MKIWTHFRKSIQTEIVGVSTSGQVQSPGGGVDQEQAEEVAANVEEDDEAGRHVDVPDTPLAAIQLYIDLD